MRKCLRCDTDMVEDLIVMVSNGGYGVDVREKGMFKGSLGKVKCAACPACGYVVQRYCLHKMCALVILSCTREEAWYDK